MSIWRSSYFYIFYLEHPNLSTKLVALWDLSSATFNTVTGNPGADLKAFNGVLVRNGHAILDGQHGYLDAGDFQGECFSGKNIGKLKK